MDEDKSNRYESNKNKSQQLKDKFQSFIDIFSHDWAVKIYCVIIAILLCWVTRASNVETKVFSVPLSVISEKTLIPASKIRERISVTVRSSKDNMVELRESDFKAYLDVDLYFNEGIYDVPVNVELSSKLQTIRPLEVTTSPSTVTISLEEKTRKKIQLVPRDAATPAEGYEVSDLKIQPEEIFIEGPKSLVEDYADSITIPISVADRNESFTQSRNIDSIISSPLIKKVSSSETLYVSVSIQPVQDTKTFTDVKATFKSLNPFFEVKQNTPLSITVSGAKNFLDKFVLPQDAIRVDCSSIQTVGIYDLPYTIHLPSDVKVVNRSVSNLTFSAEIAPVDENIVDIKTE